MRRLAARFCIRLGIFLGILLSLVAGREARGATAGASSTTDQTALAIDPDAAAALTPTLRASELGTPPIELPGNGSPRGPAFSLGNTALDTEISRLRARALAPAANPGRAASQQASAAWILGLLYLHGIGVAPAPAEAASWFARAYAQGEPLAAAGLAWCEIDGCSGAPNPAAARRWLAALRQANPARALYLQYLMELRMAPVQLPVPAGRSESSAQSRSNRQLLVRAAGGGDIQAKIELGLDLAEANRVTEALEQFRAASARSPTAAANAALLSEQTRKPAGPNQQAEDGSSPASQTYARARRNHRGEGQPANYVEAIRLYRLAQSQGSVEARKMLELIFSRPGPDGAVDIQWMQQLAYVNLASKALTVDSPAGRRVLGREPTPLSDLLPPMWRKYLSQNQLGR